MDRWYWFGVLIDSAGHVKLRQYHIRQAGNLFRVVVWNKGIAGRIWQARDLGLFGSFAEAKAHVKAHADQWSAAYVEIDSGTPHSADYERAQRDPTGTADPNWWASVLSVAPNADKTTVRKAYRTAALQYHPDSKADGATPDAEAFMRVQSAWEYITKTRGW